MSIIATIEYKGRNSKTCQLNLHLLLQDNVKEVKAKIHRALSVPESLMRLFCGNRELQEDDSLINYYSYTRKDSNAGGGGSGGRSLRLQLII